MELFLSFLLIVSLLMVAILGIKELADEIKWEGFWKDEEFMKENVSSDDELN